MAVLTDNLVAAQTQWLGDHYRVAEAHLAVGVVLLRSDRFDEAEAELNAAVLMNERLEPGPGLRTRAVGYAALGACLIAQSRVEEGAAMLDSVYASLAALAKEDGGTISYVRSRGLATMLLIFEGLGLHQEMERFDPLFDDGWRS